MTFLNERSLYKRVCGLCGKAIISLVHPDTPSSVYCPTCWWSDKWDPMDYGKDIDFSKPFLTQFFELRRSVPEIGRHTMESTMVNSDYCNICSYLKNCYLVFNSDYNEECLYGTYLERSKNCSDLYMSDLAEMCYGGSNLFKSYKVQYSNNCNECINVAFCKNLVGCTDCFGCINLRNKKYYFFNKAYTKEEYAQQVAMFDLGSFRQVHELKARVEKFWLQYPRKHAEGLHNTNVTGDYVFNSKNAFLNYETGGCENSKYCQFLFIAPTKDSYDFTMWGGGAERMYECMGAGGGQMDIKFAYETWSKATNLEYCWYILAQCHNLFGCVGLKNKQYCILNKQYTADAYESMREKVIEHMSAMPYTDALGREYQYGEFFPSEFSLFGYNESLAQTAFPLTKTQARAQGFLWRDPVDNKREITKRAQDLPDHINNINDGVLEEIIGCAHGGTCMEQCTVAFKVTPQELAFYRQYYIPLPRLCPNCRHYERLINRNSVSTKFLQRRCACEGAQSVSGTYSNAAKHRHGVASCAQEFFTSYSPDKPEIVYCEACYNAEVV